MEENLKIYNLLKDVPKEAQKKITGGRLNGMTDIKPMWRIESLTKTFGCVGEGWYTKTLNKEIIDGANGEKIAVVDIELYVNFKKPYGLEEDLWSKGIEGSGGSGFIAKEKAGLYTNDECFKMAYTDALSVACKSLGMGANVYWGDSKYPTKAVEVTEEEAKKFKFDKGKHPDKTILEVFEDDPNYLQWCLDNGKNEKIKQMITMLTKLEPTKPLDPEKVKLITKMQKLILETKVDYESLKNHYGVKSDVEMSVEQLKDAISILEKTK